MINIYVVIVYENENGTICHWQDQSQIVNDKSEAVESSIKRFRKENPTVKIVQVITCV